MRTILCIAIALLVMPFAGLQAKVVYVKKGATGSGDGSSWANAYTELQPAIDAALSGDEVWVAAGTYHPTSWPNLPGETEPRKRHFEMKNGVYIFGGFYGNETQMSERSIATNETILSGDFNGDDTDSDGDGFMDTNRQENAYHIFYHPTGEYYGLDDVILEGLTISSGNADGVYEFSRGGACYIDGGSSVGYDPSPTFRKCHFTQNASSSKGGAFYIDSAKSSVFESKFSYNYCLGTRFGLGSGGVFYIISSGLGTSRVDISGCTFIKNSAGHGGVIVTVTSAVLNITNSTFYQNVAEGCSVLWHAGITFSINIVNSTFAQNSASSYGAIYRSGSSYVIIKNSILWDNVPYQISEASSESKVAADDCVIQGGFLGGANIVDQDPQLRVSFRNIISNSIENRNLPRLRFWRLKLGE